MYQDLRRGELCDQNLCPDSPGPGLRCAHCPLTRLDRAYDSAAGKILRSALGLRAMIAAGIQVRRDELTAAELLALLVIKEETDSFEAEVAKRNR